MPEIKIIAGDVKNGTWQVWAEGKDPLIIKEGMEPKDGIGISNDITEITPVDESSAPSILGAAGWGTVGVALAGPFGMLAGALLGGRKEKVVFVCTLKDGRKFMAETNKKTWTRIQAVRFNAK